MTAEAVAIIRTDPPPTSWDRLAVAAPVLAGTMRRYLAQQAVTLAPSSMCSMDSILVRFGLWLTAYDPAVRGAGDINRHHIEAFKIACITDVHQHTGQPLAPATIRQRLRVLKVFFDRLIDWEFDDAPRRNPIIRGDIPPRTEPMPKFLDDDAMGRFMHQAENEPDPLRKLCVLLLARTGMRIGELCDLPANCVVRSGDTHWLHVPVGKLRTDRHVPLHPSLVELIADWKIANAAHIERTGRLLTDEVSNVDRHRVTRMVRRVAKRAGIGHVHPHQLRHTLGTQAINRGMRLEAVAALLGHKSLEMTLVYARIADHTVAEEYFESTAKVDQLYAAATARSTKGTTMTFDPDQPSSIELTRADALVLHDWLHRHEHAEITSDDTTDRTALNSLNAALERAIDETHRADYADLVKASRTHLTTATSPQ